MRAERERERERESERARERERERERESERARGREREREREAIERKTAVQVQSRDQGEVRPDPIQQATTEALKSAFAGQVGPGYFQASGQLSQCHTSEQVQNSGMWW